MDLGKKLLKMGERNESAYAIDGESTHNIPAQAIRGRGGVFSGYIDLENGFIRIDSSDLSFWLEINLRDIPCFSAAPGGEEFQAARSDFEVRREKTA